MGLSSKMEEVGKVKELEKNELGIRVLQCSGFSGWTKQEVQEEEEATNQKYRPNNINKKNEEMIIPTQNDDNDDAYTFNTYTCTHSWAEACECMESLWLVSTLSGEQLYCFSARNL